LYWCQYVVSEREGHALVFMEMNMANGVKLMQQEVPILHNDAVGPGYFRMGLAFPGLAEKIRPGQFVMVRILPQSVPLLRRPFSIHRLVFDKDKVKGIELLYKVVGEGTTLMSQMQAGDLLDILGPLGTSFSFPDKIGSVWVVAGGVGIAVLYHLVWCLKQELSVLPTVFIGGCSSGDILCEKELKSLGADVQVTTEDCSLGEMGLITSAVERSLNAGKPPDILYACGPQAMLRVVGQIAMKHKVPCQVSLESAMACGFGVCLGCAVEKEDEPGTYFHVCTDGPVFEAKDVRI
jgi:dihydroorotate dehydrogenase electron transfer subunit